MDDNVDHLIKVYVLKEDGKSITQKNEQGEEEYAFANNEDKENYLKQFNQLMHTELVILI